jgi:hypothetical protein
LGEWNNCGKIFPTKLVYRFNIESGVEVGDGSTPGVVTNNSKTFRLKNLKMTIVGRRSIAPGPVSVYYCNTAI